MSSQHRVTPSEMFYYSSTGITTQAILEEQMSKLGIVLRHSRKWIDASEVENNAASIITDILTGWDLGDDTSRRKIRVINDWANTRLRIQKNTGTDTSPTWVDLLYINTTTFAATIAGALTVEAITTHGRLTMGGNIDFNGFYAQNLAGVNGQVYSIAGKKYSTDFSNATEVLVDHNLQTKDIGWSVYDNRGNAIIPGRIAHQTVNRANFYFQPAMTGRISIFGGMGAAGINFTDGTHSFSSDEVHLNPAQFYLSQDANGKAVLNLR